MHASRAEAFDERIGRSFDISIALCLQSFRGYDRAGRRFGADRGRLRRIRGRRAPRHNARVFENLVSLWRELSTHVGPPAAMDWMRLISASGQKPRFGSPASCFRLSPSSGLRRRNPEGPGWANWRNTCYHSAHDANPCLDNDNRCSSSADCRRTPSPLRCHFEETRKKID
jgi:hypothetical protein